MQSECREVHSKGQRFKIPNQHPVISVRESEFLKIFTSVCRLAGSCSYLMVRGRFNPDREVHNSSRYPPIVSREAPRFCTSDVQNRPRPSFGRGFVFLSLSVTGLIPIPFH